MVINALVVVAEALQSDREGPDWGLDRPDSGLMLANDRAVPLLIQRLEHAGVFCRLVKLPHLSLPDVEQALFRMPDAIVTIYGHGTEPPTPASVLSRRKQPRQVIADPTIALGPCRLLCCLACFSTRLCEQIDPAKRCAFIGFAREAKVLRPRRIGLFTATERQLILEAYDYSFVSPTVLSIQLQDPHRAVDCCKHLLEVAAERCRSLLHAGGNAHLLAQIRMIECNRNGLVCV